ncbi:PLP-dependent aminotransferase family protein [Bacillus sp. FJAT-29814]|uniref:MocR-like pyridoxine biosynthesis transcription factor PdxR n=1 Tax=Bacillus sp. FJAT-29814 TaxID=1729688 RepID=UPI00083518CA|nr:PLP-dependent aminotransferase family protein [Bacillus sp. FJAT-29814]
MFEITPIFKNETGMPLYLQLVQYIKEEILYGRIHPKEKLPSKRKLSKHLGISLNTIQAAYDQLAAEGYVESKPRLGWFVAEIDEDLLPKQAVPSEKTGSEREPSSVRIDFNTGKVDLEHFPYSVWRKLTVQSLYQDQGEIFNTGHPQGEGQLRHEIAQYLFQSRGVRCTADQIVVGAGTQVLMGLLCLILGKERVFAVENPGYHRTRIVLQDFGAMTIPVSMDEEGVDVSLLKQTNANVAYVTPSHQFPYGMVMPVSRRMELLKWAEEIGGFIIEDDYDGEYRYKGRPIPSLQGLDTSGRVVYLGTFSKALIPSIRISFMVLPPKLLDRYLGHFTVYKQTVSRLHQDTLFRFMKEGYWQSHLNKMRTLYRRKQASLLTAIRLYMGEHVGVIGEKSGLHIVLDVRGGMTEAELVESALSVGVKVYPLSVYFDGPRVGGDAMVVLGFGGLTEAEINEGIRLLAETWGISQ